ncbi:MAG TPA: (d)CMP kinase, partial [Bryobacteraceae bacterium]|nr:(d)CMP kinase [Bryobacteraceae bacterium]
MQQKKPVTTAARRQIVIAIDGPSGAGKSTLARSLARRLGFTYIDTGAMYRAVALWALRARIDVDDLHRLEQLALAARIEFDGDKVLLNGEDVTPAIRQPEVTDAASRVAMAPGVRKAMRAEQRRIGEMHSLVMEGRDIGTVVFPDAQVKIFLDADPQVRAGRRAKETGAAVSQVERDLAERDQRDRSRREAPLTQAPDAEYVDSTGLSPEDVEEAILKIVRRRTSN